MLVLQKLQNQLQLILKVILWAPLRLKQQRLLLQLMLPQALIQQLLILPPLVLIQ